MSVKKAVVAGVAGVAAGLVARSLVRDKRDGDGEGTHPEGWKSVTIMGEPDDFAADGYPEPLRRLAPVLEVRIETAPGDKGFEVHARVHDDVELPDTVEEDDPEQALRRALRDAKQLFETGEILRATPRPHGHRPTTLLGVLVDRAEDDAKGEGVL